MHAIIAHIVLCLLITLDAAVIPDNYNKERRAILDQETLTAVGGKLQLNEEELIANDILMKWKMKELNDTSYPQLFDFSKHIFSYKRNFNRSKVYQIIRSMPKGAVLHAHNTMMLHPDELVKLTYEDHLYACYGNDSLTLHFSETTPNRPCSSKWALLNDLRNSSNDPDEFDVQLKSHFTLYNENSDDYNFIDSNTAWEKFDKVYDTMNPLVSYRPVREKYWYETLKQLYKDNVMYIEVRAGVHGLYELDGTYHEQKYLVDLLKNVTNKFIEEHPDFIGMKLIKTKHRAQSLDKIIEALNFTRQMKAESPDMIAGFDLVGQENKGRSLKDLLPILSEAKGEIDFFLHAGETASQGTSIDENLVDAILLGAKRIGHGYALSKHPSLMSALVKNDIALEVNVISNLVLMLVHDVRNHPLATYLAMGLPVVISSDDPGAWSAEPVSDDYFVTFMGVASKKADLRMLKQLALNSIKYSALDDEGKSRLFTVFNKQWDKFIKDLISNKSLSLVS